MQGRMRKCAAACPDFVEESGHRRCLDACPTNEFRDLVRGCVDECDPPSYRMAGSLRVCAVCQNHTASAISGYAQCVDGACPAFVRTDNGSNGQCVNQCSGDRPVHDHSGACRSVCGEYLIVHAGRQHCVSSCNNAGALAPYSKSDRLSAQHRCLERCDANDTSRVFEENGNCLRCQSSQFYGFVSGTREGLCVPDCADNAGQSGARGGLTYNFVDARHVLTCQSSAPDASVFVRGDQTFFVRDCVNMTVLNVSEPHVHAIDGSGAAVCLASCDADRFFMNGSQCRRCPDASFYFIDAGTPRCTQNCTATAGFQFHVSQPGGGVCVPACAHRFHVAPDGTRVCMDACNLLYPLSVEGTNECSATCPAGEFLERDACSTTCASGYF